MLSQFVLVLKIKIKRAFPLLVNTICLFPLSGAAGPGLVLGGLPTYLHACLLTGLLAAIDSVRGGNFLHI